MLGKYILVDGKPEPCEDVLKWGEWLERNDKERIVEHTHIGDILVSTVFLGIDHNFGGKGRPILYETMVFGGVLDQTQRRYCNVEQAEEGHRQLVEKVKLALEINQQ